MFFGGGYPGGNVYVRRGGRWERAGGGHGSGYSGQQGHNHQSGHAEQSNVSVFLQLMPLLLILLLSLASSLLSSDPTYSLSPTRLIIFTLIVKWFVSRQYTCVIENFYIVWKALWQVLYFHVSRFPYTFALSVLSLQNNKMIRLKFYYFHIYLLYICLLLFYYLFVVSFLLST